MSKQSKIQAFANKIFLLISSHNQDLNSHSSLFNQYYKKVEVDEKINDLLNSIKNIQKQIYLTTTDDLVGINLDIDIIAIIPYVAYAINSNREINFYARDENMTEYFLGTATTNENGVATYTYTGAGRGDITIIAKSDNLIEATHDIYDINVQFDTQDLTKYYRNPNEQFIANVYENGELVTNTDILYGDEYGSRTGTLMFDVNGVKYVRLYSNANNGVEWRVNLNPGEYTVNTYYNTHNKMFSTSNHITILPTIHTIEECSINYQNRYRFPFYHIDASTGGPLANATITFNINGVFYTRTTNANGNVNFNIAGQIGEIGTHKYLTSTGVDDAATGTKINFVQNKPIFRQNANGNIYTDTPLDDKAYIVCGDDDIQTIDIINGQSLTTTRIYNLNYTVIYEFSNNVIANQMAIYVHDQTDTLSFDEALKTSNVPFTRLLVAL